MENVELWSRLRRRRLNFTFSIFNFTRRVCGRAGRRKTCAHTRNISLLRIVFTTVRASDLPCTAERLPLGGQEFFPGGATILPRPASTPLLYHSPFPLAHGFLPLFSPTVRRDRFYRIVSPKPDSTREKVTFSLATPSPRRITLTRFQDGSMYRERISYVRRNLRVGKLRLRQGRDFNAEHSTGAQQRHTNRNNWFHGHGCLTANSDSHAGL